MILGLFFPFSVSLSLSDASESLSSLRSLVFNFYSELPQGSVSLSGSGGFTGSTGSIGTSGMY